MKKLLAKVKKSVTFEKISQNITNMIVEFTVENVLSFKDRQTLSLEATSLSGHPENIIRTDRLNLLKSIGIYGANGSGKSNLMIALSGMKWFVTESFKQKDEKEIDCLDPFLLNTKTEKKPTFYEIVFIKDKIRYRYGFELTNSEVISEWLFESKKIAEKELFIRKRNEIKLFSGFKEGKPYVNSVQKNVLFLTYLGTVLPKSLSHNIMEWFDKFITVYGLMHERYRNITLTMLKDAKGRKSLINFYKKLSLGFENVNVESKEFDEREVQNVPEALRNQIISDMKGKKIQIPFTHHRKFNGKEMSKELAVFKFMEHESKGSQKIFNLSGAIISTLFSGGVLIIDELDASLHPILTRAITGLFNSKETNDKNGQLIFVTHDTNLLSSKQFRRDQIYFVEKNHYDETILYSMVEYKGGVRKDESFEPNYIKGRYGAIPFIGNIKKIL